MPQLFPVDQFFPGIGIDHRTEFSIWQSLFDLVGHFTLAQLCPGTAPPLRQRLPFSKKRWFQFTGEINFWHLSEQLISLNHSLPVKFNPLTIDCMSRAKSDRAIDTTSDYLSC
jgi:hypothetical protein